MFMSKIGQKVVYLEDYMPSWFNIHSLELHFDVIDDSCIYVDSKLSITKVNNKAASLKLNGENLKTLSVELDGKQLKENVEYKISDNILEIYNVGDNFIVTIRVKINPAENSALSGIYKSDKCLCSQCESQGFRRITWFIDRPDILPLWKVSIKSDPKIYPFTISNGNLIYTENYPDGKVLNVFSDVNPKPSYLFAFVAGDFYRQEDSFITKSGRKVSLNLYLDPSKKDYGNFALSSLKSAMKWDEDTFGFEYDLDVFSIVAVSDFNFGAMENTSLNIFNESAILADPKITTDAEYLFVEKVVAHEYFHHFTGNKVTCRDWFQLTLKEGLTVFRDHKFSGDIRNPALTRAKEVEHLKTEQFAEDAGPLAHPIKLQSYISMDNFYTITVYNKGSEVVRMIETIIGEQNFKLGMTLYMKKFANQAVTTEDFVNTMQEASSIDLTQFQRWYHQSGTPVVSVQESYDPIAKNYTLELSQTYHGSDPLAIPLKIALFDTSGKKLLLNTKNDKEITFVLDKTEQLVTFHGIDSLPSLSINRGFSAPVIIKHDQTDHHLINLIKFDDDGVNQINASTLYLTKYMLDIIKSPKLATKDYIQEILSPYKFLLENYKNHVHLLPSIYLIPSFSKFAVEFSIDMPIEAISSTHALFEENMGKLYVDFWEEIFVSLKDDDETFSTEMVSIRSLKNMALHYLVKTQDPKYLDFVQDYYENTQSMTKKIAALAAIKDLTKLGLREKLFTDFFDNYGSFSITLNKWLSLQALTNSLDTLDNLKKIIKSDFFNYSNPNIVRSVFGVFTRNYQGFHDTTGSGYKFLAENLPILDKLNPLNASNLAKRFATLSNQTMLRKQIAKKYIQDLLNMKDISSALFEVLEQINKEDDLK